jgi:hypothetical protein
VKVWKFDSKCFYQFKIAVSWDVTPCGSPILVTLMMGAIHSSETSDFTRATRRNILEDGILPSHCLENHRSYTFLPIDLKTFAEEGS